MGLLFLLLPEGQPHLPLSSFFLTRTRKPHTDLYSFSCCRSGCKVKKYETQSLVLDVCTKVGPLLTFLTLISSWKQMGGRPWLPINCTFQKMEIHSYLWIYFVLAYTRQSGIWSKLFQSSLGFQSSVEYYALPPKELPQIWTFGLSLV